MICFSVIAINWKWWLVIISKKETINDVNILHLYSAVWMFQRRFLSTIYIAVQAGFRTRHITTVAIIAASRNEILWDNLQN